MKQVTFFRLGNFWQIWKLIFLNYWANKLNLFNDFVLPLLLVAILVSALGKQVLIDFYPGLMAAPLLSIGFISFPACYVQWKNSGLFKRLRMCGFHSLIMVLLFSIFYLVVAAWAVVLTFLYCWFFDEYVVQPPANQTFLYFMQNCQLEWFIIGLLELQLLLIGFAFLIASFVQNEKSVIGIGIILLMIHSFLLGCYIPMRFTLRSNIISTLAMALPGYAPLRTMQASFLTIPEFSTNMEVPHLDADWKLHFWMHGKYESKTFSFSKGYGWHICLVGGWFLFLQTCLLLHERYRKQ